MNVAKARASKPLLILLYGFPGAGKTHFARSLTDILECAHLHSDKVRHEIFDEPRYDEQSENIVNHLMQYMAEEFLHAGISVIYDSNAIRKSQRVELRNLARKNGAQTLIIWFQIDPDTAYERTRNRDRRKTDDKYAVEYSTAEFRKIAARMQHPEPTEDYVVISGKHTFGSQKSAVLIKLVEMGLINPEQHKPQVMVKPGLVNLIPKTVGGRVDLSRRNINIR